MNLSQSQRAFLMLALLFITSTNLAISVAAQTCTCWPFFCAGDSENCFNRCFEHEGCDFCWGGINNWCTDCTLNAWCGSAWECYCMDSYRFRHVCYEETGDCWPW